MDKVFCWRNNCTSEVVAVQAGTILKAFDILAQVIPEDAYSDWHFVASGRADFMRDDLANSGVVVL